MERLKTYLGSYLAGEKFKTSKVIISYRESKSVIVDDISKLKNDYLRFKDPEPIKEKLKEVLEKQGEMDGVHMQVKQNLIIR